MQNVVNYDNPEQFYDKISITNANIIKKTLPTILYVKNTRWRSILY
jgi:hypothetical protein